MSDVGEMWSEVRKESQAKRQRNRQSGPEILRSHGISFESKNRGAHLIVDAGTTKADFWPGTGKWIIRGGKTGRGVRSLIREITQAEAVTA